jgi:zinc transport system substrate-binding protein
MLGVHMFSLHRLFAVVVMTVVLTCLSQAQAGILVASTHPLFTAGVETPVLLLPPASSGHDINLRPSDRLLLKQSDFVIWFGRDYEAPLYDLLAHQQNAIALFDLKIFRSLPLRDLKGQAIPYSRDPHLWLDPENAIKIADYIALVRGRQFPAHAAQYQHNAQRFAEQLRAVVSAQKSKTPRFYWAYHDAYHYLESALNFKFAGALTSDPDLPPSIGQLLWLNQNRPHQDSMCLFAERQPTAALIAKLGLIHYNFVQGWQFLAQRLEECQH